MRISRFAPYALIGSVIAAAIATPYSIGVRRDNERTERSMLARRVAVMIKSTTNSERDTDYTTNPSGKAPCVQYHVRTKSGQLITFIDRKYINTIDSEDALVIYTSGDILDTKNKHVDTGLTGNTDNLIPEGYRSALETVIRDLEE